VSFGRGGTVTGPVERRVLGEHGCVQPPQRLPRIDAELTGEQVADPPVGGQRVGLPASPVQRQDELAM